MMHPHTVSLTVISGILTASVLHGQAFSSITSGTNTSAAMVVGSGASLAPTGTGTIKANGLQHPLVINATDPTSTGGCGLAMDGTTDDTSALNTCIGNVTGDGAELRFPAGKTVIGNLTITKDGVRLVGAGSGGYGSVTPAGATQFLYPGAGSTSGYIVRFCGTANCSTGGRNNYSSGISGITLDGHSRALTGLWLTDVWQFQANDVSIINFGNAGTASTLGHGIKVDATGVTSGAGCGDGSGVSVFDNIFISAGGGYVNGITLGDATYDVCSLKFGKVFLQAGGAPPSHGISFVQSDSDTFDNVSAFALTGLAVTTGGVSVSGNTATITTSTTHGISNGTQDGIWIGGATTYNSGTGMCTAVEVPGLEGNFIGTFSGTNTISITVSGVSAGTYCMNLISGSSVMLGSNINNVTYFGSLHTDNGIESLHNGGIAANSSVGGFNIEANYYRFFKPANVGDVAISTKQGDLVNWGFQGTVNFRKADGSNARWAALDSSEANVDIALPEVVTAYSGSGYSGYAFKVAYGGISDVLLHVANTDGAHSGKDYAWDSANSNTGLPRGQGFYLLLNDATNSTYLAWFSTTGVIDAKTGFTVNGSSSFSGTKTAGSCSIAVSGGIITNITGC
jgi:hypothetical protein